jgi:hypothetical protein
MSSISRIIYEIKADFNVYFDNSDFKHEKLTLQAINYETYLDASMYCKKTIVIISYSFLFFISADWSRQNYMARNWIHTQTQLLHEKTILKEQQFTEILKKHTSTPKNISIEVHVCIERPDSGWYSLMPEETRKPF